MSITIKFDVTDLIFYKIILLLVAYNNKFTNKWNYNFNWHILIRNIFKYKFSNFILILLKIISIKSYDKRLLIIYNYNKL